MSFNEELQKRIEIMNTGLNRYFRDDETCAYQSLIDEAMRYSLLNGGKRIRPIILYEMTRILGGNKEEGLALACALEMVHTYSLIHDDLPAMDDDDIRRGKASNHIEYGEDIAILAGDGLLNHAYEVMFSEVLSKQPTPNKVMACSTVANAAGSRGMILGQVADIKMKERSTAALDYINKYKTGALIEAAFVAAGYLCNTDNIDVLKRIGQNLGKGFQIQDDVLDVIGNEDLLGKPIGSDQKNEKVTYVDLLGVEGATNAFKSCYDVCIEELTTIPNSDFLMELVRYLLSRTH